MSFDTRVTPARPDLAADFLAGKVTAEKFVGGIAMRVARGRMALHRAPLSDSARVSELLFGESFTVYEEKDGWNWGQAQTDGYVGYLHCAALGPASGPAAPAHKVTAVLTPLLPAPDVKSFARDMLPLNAVVKVEAQEGSYARLADGGFVHASHLAPLDVFAPDWVAVAEGFVGAPYLWGGKTWSGLDCSGLIQTSLAAAGIAAPRDTDMMEAHFTTSADAPQRGDLIFWKGHMGVMLDAARLLHANVFHMAVAVEKLAEAVARIEKKTGPITSVKRPRS